MIAVTVHVKYEKVEGRYMAENDNYKRKIKEVLGDCVIPYCIKSLGPRKCKPFFPQVRAENNRFYSVKVVPEFID